MARPLRLEFDGAFYHITARGNERKNIFFGQADYRKFHSYLKEAGKKFGIFIHAYVLMTNHYHLLIETPQSNLSRVMHHINGSYTTYINIKRKRCGHLFQGRYKSILIQQDSYLTELSRYIHLNPVRAGLVQRPEDYRYSSYGAYITDKSDDMVNTDMILRAMAVGKKEARAKYRVFVEAAIGRVMESPVKDCYGGIIMGKERFIKDTLKRIKQEYLDKEGISQRKALRKKYDMNELLIQVAGKYKVAPEDILRGIPADAKKVAVYVLKRNSGLNNREIGEQFGGLTYSAVAKICSRLEEKIERNRSIERVVASIERNLSNVKP